MVSGRRALVGGAVALALATLGARDVRAAEASSDCDVVDVEYAVSANLRIAGTAMGSGDGEHKIGPGRLVLRFKPESGGVASVSMTSFELRQRFLIVAKVAFWTTRVLTDIETRATPGLHATVAEGSLSQHSLHWTSLTGAFHDDGSLTCDGFFCGKFGAPPTGMSDYHMAPQTMAFSPFEFSADNKTFTMRSTLATKTADPQQESYIALAGRELRRSCVAGTTP
jgi:hypothetical protein